MSIKERLHQIIDEMNDDQASVLLMDLEEPIPPLTADERAAIDEGRAQLRAGLGIPHEQALRELGLKK